MTWQLWVGIAFILVIAEIFSLTFYLILFAIGAFAAAVVQAGGLSLAWQIMTFVVLSLVLTYFLQPILKRTFIDHQGRPSNVDAMVGLRGYADEEVNDEHGLVKVEKEVWSARSFDGKPIPAGTPVEVVRVEGVKLIVKQLTMDN